MHGDKKIVSMIDAWEIEERMKKWVHDERRTSFTPTKMRMLPVPSTDSQEWCAATISIHGYVSRYDVIVVMNIFYVRYSICGFVMHAKTAKIPICIFAHINHSYHAICCFRENKQK